MNIDQAHTQRQEDFALYRTIINTMEEGVVVQDTHGRIVMSNPAAEGILGLTADQMRGRSAVDSHWPLIQKDGSSFPRDRHPVVLALRTGKPQSDIMMGIHRPDGTQTWVNIKCQPVYREEETRPYGVVSIFSDITKHWHIENRIRLLAQFPAENPNPVLRIAPNGVILYANASSAALLNFWGIEPGQILPEAVSDLVTASLEDEASQMMEVTLSSQVLALTFSPDEEGQYVNIYGLDITHRKQAEKALQDSEKTTRMLLKAAPISIVVVDETGHIVLVNDHAIELFGYAHAELINKPLEVLIPEKVRPVHAHYCAGYIHDPHVRPMGNDLNLTAQHKDGHTFPVVINLGFVETKQGLLTMAFIIDMTKQHELEALREAMIRMMVHDLRNPLGAIYTGVTFLMEDAETPLPDHVRQILDIASRNTERMLALIKSILDVSQLESGQLPINRTPFSLHQLVTDTLASASTLVEKKELRVYNEVPPTLPEALADVSLIARVLQNLTDNAIKFTPQRGSVWITAEGPKTGKLRIAISDSGSGISPEIHDRLFQKFITGNHKERGNGLGLAFCKLAVEAHGERIEAESVPGQGTTFWFTLPTTQ